MALARKGNPFRIIGRGSFEEEYVSVPGIHGVQFIFTDWYYELSLPVFIFVWWFIIEDIFEFVMF